jgi:hypothetical protein
MAEAGPSGTHFVAGAVNPRHSGLPQTQDGSQSQSQNRGPRANRAIDINSLGLGHPSMSRKPTGSRISSLESNGSRRRVRSTPADDHVLPPGPSRLRHSQDLEIVPHKRLSSLAGRGNGKQKAVLASFGSPDVNADYAPTSFSDEYDLCASSIRGSHELY